MKPKKWQYLNSKKIPKVYTEKAFLYLLTINDKHFKSIIDNKSAHYKKESKIKKDGASTRLIFKPDTSLKTILKKINRKYLSHINYPTFVHCGPKKKSILSACKPHRFFNKHLSLDIESFFDSITEKTVFETLSFVGVPKKIVASIVRCTVEENHLPQGFPTSSLLSALVISKAFEEVFFQYDRKKIVISFYADDILISSNEDILITEVEQVIVNKLNELGLKINSKRTEGKKGEKFLWLGLQIHPWISQPRNRLKLIQKQIHIHKQKGLVPQDFKPKKPDQERSLQWKNSVKGKLQFAKFISHNKLIDKSLKEI